MDVFEDFLTRKTEQGREQSPFMAREKNGNICRVGIFLDFVRA